MSNMPFEPPQATGSQKLAVASTIPEHDRALGTEPKRPMTTGQNRWNCPEATPGRAPPPTQTTSPSPTPDTPTRISFPPTLHPIRIIKHKVVILPYLFSFI